MQWARGGGRSRPVDGRIRRRSADQWWWAMRALWMEAFRRDACLQSTMVSMESSFHPSGMLVWVAALVAGDAGRARFDLMCLARMPSSMCWSQYLLGALPLRPAAPHTWHGPVGAMRNRCVAPPCEQRSTCTRQRSSQGVESRAQGRADGQGVREERLACVRAACRRPLAGRSGSGLGSASGRRGPHPLQQLPVSGNGEANST
jgi:hypothetical protein